MFDCKEPKHVHPTVGEWCCFLWSAGRKICHLLFPYSSSKPSALNTIRDQLLNSRIGTNYQVSSSSYFIQSDPSISNLAMTMLKDEILSIRCLQSSLIWQFCNLPPTWITADSSINGSSWDILQFLFNLLESLSFPSINLNHLYSSLKCFCWTNFTNDIVDSWIMVVVICVVVTSSVIIFLCFILVFRFFTNSIISATILIIFDQVEAWFSRTDKMSVCTTIWFTCTTFFSSESSGLMAGVLVLVF